MKISWFESEKSVATLKNSFVYFLLLFIGGMILIFHFNDC